MPRSLPRYSLFEGDVCRAVHIPSVGLVPEAWDPERGWVRRGNVPELDFKGVPLSAEEAALRTSAPEGALASAGDVSSAARGHDEAGAS